MKDFKSYSSERKTASENGDLKGAGADGKNADGGTENQFNSTVEMAKIITKAMNGKTETQILHTILSEAERGKREGTLTNEDLDNFYSALYPLLDGAKRRKLKEVITRLKNL